MLGRILKKYILAQILASIKVQNNISKINVNNQCNTFPKSIQYELGYEYRSVADWSQIKNIYQGHIDPIWLQFLSYFHPILTRF